MHISPKSYSNSQKANPIASQISPSPSQHTIAIIVKMIPKYLPQPPKIPLIKCCPLWQLKYGPWIQGWENKCVLIKRQKLISDGAIYTSRGMEFQSQGTRMEAALFLCTYDNSEKSNKMITESDIRTTPSVHAKVKNNMYSIWKAMLRFLVYLKTTCDHTY